MKVKKYVASSMPEAMKQLRAELGNGAVIINTRVVHTGGFLGLFKKKSIEVLAANDLQTSNQQKSVTQTKTASSVKSPPITPGPGTLGEIVKEKKEPPS